MDKYDTSGTNIDKSYSYHTNGIGSITAITDKDGNIVERYNYGLYGLPVIKNNSGNVITQSSIDNEYMFQGRRFEKESGLYYYRARHFDPVMGRFLQGDSLGYRDSMNLYQGMNMNGFNFVDPMGEGIFDWLLPSEKDKYGNPIVNDIRVNREKYIVPSPQERVQHIVKQISKKFSHNLQFLSIDLRNGEWVKLGTGVQLSLLGATVRGELYFMEDNKYRYLMCSYGGGGTSQTGGYNVFVTAGYGKKKSTTPYSVITALAWSQGIKVASASGTASGNGEMSVSFDYGIGNSCLSVEAYIILMKDIVIFRIKK